MRKMATVNGIIAIGTMLLSLTACGGGGGDDATTRTPTFNNTSTAVRFNNISTTTSPVINITTPPPVVTVTPPVINITTPPPTVVVVTPQTPAAPAPVVAATSVPVHRFLNVQTQKHFWSADLNEVNNLILIDVNNRAAGLPVVRNYEGVSFRAFNSPQPGTIPVNRFYNTVLKQHFWSFDPVKTNNLILLSLSSTTIKSDGISFHIYPVPTPGAIPLEHLVNTTNDDQLYTIDQKEKANALLNLNPPNFWKVDPFDPVVGFVPSL